MLFQKENCKLKFLDLSDDSLVDKCIGCGFKLYCDIRF